MHPIAKPSGWLLGAVAQFDSMTDLADRVIAQLATRGATAEIVELRRRMREVDGRDEGSVTALAAEFRQRASELAP